MNLRRLKNSLRCALVVAIFTRRQLRSTYSWISARIQWTANETRRTPTSGSKRLHGLHEADVAFLDEVAERQTVAEVAAGDVHDEAQVRQHQVARGVEIAAVAQLPGEPLLVSGVSTGMPTHGLHVGIDAADRAGPGPDGCADSRSAAVIAMGPPFVMARILALVELEC